MSAGRPQFALITGEPGIGKTHLAEETADRAARRGHLVVVARCPATAGTPGFWPWTQVLRQLSHLAPEGTDFEAGESAARLLAAAARERPVLVVLDDLHWADPASLRLLSHLAQTFTDGRVTIVATARDHTAPAQAFNPGASTPALQRISAHSGVSTRRAVRHSTRRPAPALSPALNSALTDAVRRWRGGGPCGFRWPASPCPN